MTLMVVPSGDVSKVDFVPQAVLNKPLGYFATKLRASVETGLDDLDHYESISFNRNGLLFAVRHYKGHPDNTVTIYLPSKFHEVEQITNIVSNILSELSVSGEDILWQRRDDPDL